MRSQVASEATLLNVPWLEDLNVNANVNVNANAIDDLELSLLGLVDDSVVGKVNEHKLAHDVDDLSAIFEQLEDGDVDFTLPCDDEDDEVAQELHDGVAPAHQEDWIEDLDRDVVNVEELSAAFDLLAEQVENAEMEDGSEASDDADDEDVEDVRVVPAAPAWIATAPLDPRSVIRSTIFKGLDPRIPSVSIPRMDLGFGATAPKCAGLCGPAMAGARVGGATPTLNSPKSCGSVDADEYEYKHDPATCWICKSDKTAFRKFALHRYLEKRHRRNWKRGPRYSGRSHVATNRVREGGRFVCTARWV